MPFSTTLSVEDRIGVALLDTAIKRARATVWAQIFGFVVIGGTAMVYGVRAPAILVMALGVVVAIWRVTMAWRWQRVADKAMARRRYAWGYAAMAGVGGLANLVVVLWIYTTLPAEAAGLMLVVMVGALAVAALFLSLVTFAVTLYMMPAMLALMYVSLNGPGNDSLALVLVVPIYVIINLRASRDNYESAVAGIRQRIQLEETAAALEVSRREADTANRAKSQFLANMSHEIRTPMNGVMGSLELMADGKLDEAQQRWLGVARASGAGLLALINDVLDYSKLEVGKLKFMHEPFDVRHVVSNAVMLFSASAQQKNIELVASVDKAVPQVVTGDALRLGQVLLNLLGNAVKFTPRGSVSLLVSALSHGAQGDNCVLRFDVIDTGVGIADDQAGALFQPFSQADATDSRPHQGAGLGLAISRQIVEGMQGEISFISIPGAGSTFSFTIPATITAADDAAARHRATPAMREAAQGEAVHAAVTPEQHAAALKAAGMRRVLIAEDNAFNRLVLRHMLELLGLAVDEADNGAAALAHWRSARPDALLLDCQMPMQSGYDVTAAIRREEAEAARRGESPRKERTYIVAVTANALSGDREKCLAAGMDAYLPKPFTLAEVGQVLREKPQASGVSQIQQVSIAEAKVAD